MIARALSLLCIALLSATSAVAEDAPRKIDFGVVLSGPNGPFKECRKLDETTGKCTEEVPLTLGLLCVSVAALPDKGASLVDQVSHGRLATRILEATSQPGSKDLALSAEDVTFLKGQIAKTGYNTMAVYQASRLLDPGAEK